MPCGSFLAKTEVEVFSRGGTGGKEASGEADQLFLVAHEDVRIGASGEIAQRSAKMAVARGIDMNGLRKRPRDGRFGVGKRNAD